MPEADFRLEDLVRQLRDMPRRDRNLILARLDAEDRGRMLALLGEAWPTSSCPYSQDIAMRIASLTASGEGMTPAGRKALGEVAQGQGESPVTLQGASLADTIGGFLRMRWNSL